MITKEKMAGIRFIVLLDDDEAIIVQDGRIVETTYWVRDWDDIIVKNVPTRDGRNRY